MAGPSCLSHLSPRLENGSASPTIAITQGTLPLPRKYGNAATVCGTGADSKLL